MIEGLEESNAQSTKSCNVEVFSSPIDADNYGPRGLLLKFRCNHGVYEGSKENTMCATTSMLRSESFRGVLSGQDLKEVIRGCECVLSRLLDLRPRPLWRYALGPSQSPVVSTR
jgi:hypothetical protein